MNYGFVRIAVAVPEIKVANCIFNAKSIIKQMKEARLGGASFCLFPELSISGYTCADLFHTDTLQASVIDNLNKIVIETKKPAYADMIAIVGAPLKNANRLYNCAVVIQGGEILGVAVKTCLPSYSEFYEKRWFVSGEGSDAGEITLLGQAVPFGNDLVFKCESNPEIAFGVEICEDLWAPVAQSSKHAVAGANILFNLSASDETIGKHAYRQSLISQQSASCISAYVYASAGIGESTTDLVFGGYGAIYENGNLLSESERFVPSSLTFADVDAKRLNSERLRNTTFSGSENFYLNEIFFAMEPLSLENPDDLQRFVDPHPFVPSSKYKMNERCKEIFNIQTAGLMKRLSHMKCENAIIGISGGLDSTLALLVTVAAFEKLKIKHSNIKALTMPGFGTTDQTYNNAIALMKSLKVEVIEIDIKDACLRHFEAIGHPADQHDVTFENVQARERTQLLMDYAGRVNGIVVGTGDMSELALGWCTYNGDHMSNYGVNAGVPKTLVKHLVEWVADNHIDKNSKAILHRVIETPISPELLPPDGEGQIAQKTEDIVGPYELHDFFLYHFIKYGAEPTKILYLAEGAFKGVYSKGTITIWLITFLKRFFSQQFKRSCIPDAPKVGTISLSPRGDWRMPSDACVDIWLKELTENK
ncbi:MAG: NAD(+) synthase [Bacillota bacterium]